MSGLNDILNNGKSMISQEQLIAYLEGRLSAEEQHDVELWLAEEGMESDALEGPRDLSAEETKRAIFKLNYNLRNQLSGRKNKRREPLDQNVLAWVAVIVILVLCVVGYVVFKYAIHK